MGGYLRMTREAETGEQDLPVSYANRYSNVKSLNVSHRSVVSHLSRPKPHLASWIGHHLRLTPECLYVTFSVPLSLETKLYEAPSAGYVAVLEEPVVPA